MTARGGVRRGLAAVNAVRNAPSWARLTEERVAEEHLADVTADVLHLGTHLGLDPDEVLDHGRRYYTGDIEEPWT